MARQGFKSIDVATVNGNTVRLRTMRTFTARWHTHVESDELFYVLSGLFHLDTDERTVDVRAGELFVVPAGMRHRGRAGAPTTLLVIDCIRGDAPSAGHYLSWGRHSSGTSFHALVDRERLAGSCS
jgi:mannose-6-phosphate isomerase-like protein (cupin superfamily)